MLQVNLHLQFYIYLTKYRDILTNIFNPDKRVLRATIFETEGKRGNWELVALQYNKGGAG